VVNYHEAVFQAANSAIKDTIGSLDLTELLGEREKVSTALRRLLTRPLPVWCGRILGGVTDVRVPQDLIQELEHPGAVPPFCTGQDRRADAEKSVAQKFQEAAS
jgi:regulator of protease activity HflC (stomatin/prohibitin superfamily)